jgi:DNA (cytosine-5)-methyltransferase 1
VESRLCVLRRNTDCKGMGEPVNTLTAAAGHFAKVDTRLAKIGQGGGLGNWPAVRELLNKYAGRKIADDEILIFDIYGVPYFICDIGMRMLEPRELFNAQGFLPDYIIDVETVTGKPYSKAKQIARCGNSVCPPMAEALARANLPELCSRRFKTMKEFNEEIAV